MRERALRAEEQVDRLIYRLGKIADGGLDRKISIPHDIPHDIPRKVLSEKVTVRESRPVAVPPMVEHAIRKRAKVGSPLEAQLMDEARTAIEAMGADFDEEAFARQIVSGTRIDGWPV